MPLGLNKANVVFVFIVLLILMPNLLMIQGYSSHVLNPYTMYEDRYEEYNSYIHKVYDSSDFFIYEYHEKKEPFSIDSSVEVHTTFETFFCNRDGLMNSAWPMYCHDIRHTGRSPYTTMNTTGILKWKLDTYGWANGGPVIDKNGTIYIGSYELNAVYPNGTLKWKFNAGYCIASAPAIAEDGTIYFGDIYGYNRLYALNPNGTIKWIYLTGGYVFSSPVIGNDGTIYVGSGENSIHAIYPNGTRKWKFETNHVVYSSPAIGSDGTIYCGCHDTYLYALYPENGTMKWKYKTGDWIRTSPCITEDGTVYVVSLDAYLHAVYPNGTMKWKTFCGAGTSPTIGWDGTIYCGYSDLYAINPENGSVKWIYDVPGTLEGATPCNSIDGTIYLGTWEGGCLIAINPDGTEKWRKYIGITDSPPAISADGTVYIGSSIDTGVGCLYAFGPLDSNAPDNPIIQGQLKGKVNKEYSYTFSSTDPFGKDVWYYISWGDGTVEDWIGPYPSGETVTMSHSWSEKGTYKIEARAKNSENLWGPYGTLEVTMPFSYESPHLQLINWLLEHFPHAFPILRYLLDYY